MKIKKAIIPIAGLGTRFLPISKTIPKEFLPLNSKPVIHYIVEEALEAGVKEFIFVISPEKKEVFRNYILKYFQGEKKELIKTLKERGKKEALEALKGIPKIKFRSFLQKKQKGDGDAILKAEKLLKNEPFLVLFGDDLSFGEKSFPLQLVKTFEKIKKPILCLYKMKRKSLINYGVPKVKKIDERIYKILDIVEKPKDNPPSNFALVGNYVLTPEIFPFLKTTPLQNGELILANALKKMIQNGKEVLGLEVEGKWLECGSLEKWMKSFLFLAKLTH
jgi:UTP--glucose-1-phosphate uridylyltransferase